ncbi:MAG: recombination mediator RecR [Candidatus Amesbacteria bacterium]|nr:recombination mediator RecR [Candidatus Amesbacteria bacterium]
MRIARAINNLIEGFERLPGVGPKSAARLTYYLLHVPQIELDKFADAIRNLKLNTKECNICHNVSELDPCDICDDVSRDKNIICVVEQPLDVLAFERGGRYKGVYHVLHGVIDPLHNIGPDEIKIDELLNRAQDTSHRTQEIILALNPNMEGESTCMYIKRQIANCKLQIKISRLAHGLPTGADVQYADETTLTHALNNRREF